MCGVEERVTAHVGGQLLEHGGALGVGDPVEVLTGGLEVDDVRDDGVRRRHLVLHVRPGLAAGREGHPRGPEVGGLVHAEGAHVVRERLLEPQVVPPVHRHEVAEPHVRHLVQDHVGAALVLDRGGPRGEHEVLGEGHEARVLHGAEVVLGHERLVVLAPRVRDAEEVVEERQPPLRHVEHGLGVERVGHRAPGEQPQRHGLRTAGRVTVPGVLPLRIGAGEQRRDVGGLGERRGELHPDDTVPGRRPGDLRPVRGQHPVLGSGEGEGEGGLEVRLLEVREHAARVGGLVLGVEVDLAVGGVREAVQALARPGVHGPADQLDHVLRRQVGQQHPGLAHDLGHVQRRAVEGHRLHAAVDPVQVGLRAGLGAREADHGADRIGVGGGVPGVGEVHVHDVVLHREQAGAVRGLRAGDVGGVEVGGGVGQGEPPVGDPAGTATRGHTGACPRVGGGPGPAARGRVSAASGRAGPWRAPSARILSRCSRSPRPPPGRSRCARPGARPRSCPGSRCARGPPRRS
ncbi:Uncharacterised protein [Streptococcus pneumoniae]|nr:Uncharacterised protein [Streptococcus pneumoniae]